MDEQRIDAKVDQIEEQTQPEQVRSSCAHFPQEEGPRPKGKCARPNDSSRAVSTQRTTTCVEFSEDISTTSYPTRYSVRGLLPVEERDADGKLVRDKTGTVQLSPRFHRVRIRGAQWIDEVMLSVGQLLPTISHVRVLMALHAMTNALKHSDITPRAHWCNEVGRVVADDGSTDRTCGYTVPSLCVRISDLSYNNVSRFLHPDRSIVLDQLRADADRSGMRFDPDAAHQLLGDYVIGEAEFTRCIDDLTNLELLVLLNEAGQRVAVLNHLSIARCTPTMRPTMLQGAPSAAAMADPVDRDQRTTAGGVVKPKSKKRSQGNRALRERVGQLSASNQRKDRAMLIMERHHAEDRAKLTAERDDAQAKVDALTRVFEHGLAIIRAMQRRSRRSMHWRVRSSGTTAAPSMRCNNARRARRQSNHDLRYCLFNQVVGCSSTASVRGSQRRCHVVPELDAEGYHADWRGRCVLGRKVGARVVVRRRTIGA